MNSRTRIQSAYMAIVGVAAIVALAGGLFAAWAADSSAAPTVAPSNTGEPSVTGTTRVGQTLRTTRGTWTGTAPISYAFRWYRCDGRGAPDASDCQRISNATNNTYTLRQGDAGFRIRSQVVATNADGTARATSNPTSVVISARPTNLTEPSITGTASVGSRLHAHTWNGSREPASCVLSSIAAVCGPTSCPAARSPSETSSSRSTESRGAGVARSAFSHGAEGR